MRSLTAAQVRVYVVRVHPGISGFRDFSRHELVMVRADSAMLRGATDNAEPYDRRKHGQRLFRLNNGRLPDYQPTMYGANAVYEVVKHGYSATSVHAVPAARGASGA